MAPTVARLLLAAAALVNVVAGYKAKEYGAMIEAATSPSSPIPSGINCGFCITKGPAKADGTDDQF